MTSEKNQATVVSINQQTNLIVEKVYRAQQQYASYTQEQVDTIFAAVARAINHARIALSKEAVAETRMGIVEDKVIKNHYAAEYIYNKYKNFKSVGVIRHDPATGIREIADPVGVIAAVIPTTNPTSTAAFKILLALKTRNGIIISPHPRAKACTVKTARIALEAAVAAGAPEGIIGWLESPSVEDTQQLMQHPKIDLILATGGPGMVKSAYASGKPALGVGAGNTPVLVDETADIPVAVNSILLSKTFDNGVICASEQAVVVVDSIYKAFRAELQKRGAYILNESEKSKIAGVMVKNGKISSAIVGQSALTIAQSANLQVPANTKLLIAEVERVGPEEPFSLEKLSPILALYRAANFSAGIRICIDLLHNGGLGHTAVLYSNPGNRERIESFAHGMKAGRILVNSPSSHGAIGDLFNFEMAPSLTLGCGTWGGNSVSENVGVEHLLNIKTQAERRDNMLWFRVPSRVYFKAGCLEFALRDLVGRKRAFVVTDRMIAKLGMVDRVTKILTNLGITSEVFQEVKPDPALDEIEAGVEAMKRFNPDLIIALGGGSPIDAAKIMWLLYEHPQTKFEDLAMRFMDIRKRISGSGELGHKAELVAIPTTSGTGSEVTPFAVVTGRDGVKYPIADYELTPFMAIVDSDLVMDMPSGLTAASGMDAVTHALEAMVAITATEFTNGHALESLVQLFNWLPQSYRGGANNREAREKVHHAATMAGMAFANAFLGVCHAMAHKLGSTFHIPHGVANGILIPHVVRFNADDAPNKLPAFSQYGKPEAKQRYARVADCLGLKGKTVDDKVEALIQALETLRKELGLPATIKEAGVNKLDFERCLDQLAENAFDDQCLGANPRYPLIDEIKAIYRAAFE